jgi:hypothetical protein
MLNQFTNPWHKQDLDFLRENYPRCGCRTVAERLGRTENAVFKKASLMGLKRYRPWSSAELRILREEYPKIGSSIATKLGRSRSMVHNMAQKLGLHADLRDKVRLLSNEERAYIAGLVDGEGSLILGKNRGRLFPFLRITNTSLMLLNHVKSVIGCGTICRHEWKNLLDKNRRPTWSYSLSAGGLRALLPQIKDYLVLKKPHCSLMLEFLAITDERRRIPRGNRKGLKVPYTARQMEIMNKIKKLNKRGN